MDQHDKMITKRKVVLIISLMILLTTSIAAQGQLDVMRIRHDIMPIPNNHWIHYTDASNSLIHYLNEEAFKFLDARSEKTSRIKTLEEWKERQSRIRQTIWNILGPFPEKTPLNPKITGKVKKKGYAMENIIYESLPHFYVTASLFIPDNLKAPAPAILFCSGHSREAYRKQSYQLPILNLVKKGFIVFAIDPIGQGERLQYLNTETDESLIGSTKSVTIKKEHSYPSAQIFLTGQSIARYFIWDGIRGIDYLISRKEVDPKRIGVHGNSGGGTQTAYVSALDERVAASAPSCYITNYKRLMQSIGVQDGEQNFYHGILNGIDHADFIEARAPKPTLIMATTRDFFSIQGTRETYKEVKRIYERFGEPDHIKITEDDFEHGYTQKNREAMYAFFQKYLKIPGSPLEEKVDFLSEKELQKTSTGQLSTSLDSQTVFSLNQKEAKKLQSKLETSRDNLTKHLPGIINSAKTFSGYINPCLTDEPVFTGRIQRNGYVIEKYFIKGEGNYVIPYLLSIPDKANSKAVVTLYPSGKTAGFEDGETELLISKGFTVLTPDLIGTGEVGPGDFRGVNLDDISYNIWFSAVLIGRSIVGIQASDVVKLAHFLLRDKKITDIYGIAHKETCPVLLHASAFDHAFSRVALINPYSSYRSVVMSRFYQPGFVHSFVPGALTAYDLPDLAASLAPRKLLIAGVTDGNAMTVNMDHIKEDFDIIIRNYEHTSAVDQLSIIDRKPVDFYLNWLK